jgi:hypothetical protein
MVSRAVVVAVLALPARHRLAILARPGKRLPWACATAATRTGRRRLDDLHIERRLGADAYVARLMILGAINRETSALFLREVSP